MPRSVDTACIWLQMLPLASDPLIMWYYGQYIYEAKVMYFIFNVKQRWHLDFKLTVQNNSCLAPDILYKEHLQRLGS